MGDITAHFSTWEAACRCRRVGTCLWTAPPDWRGHVPEVLRVIDLRLFTDFLEPMRVWIDVPVDLTSVIRCAYWNEKQAPKSKHKTHVPRVWDGELHQWAVDFRVRDRARTWDAHRFLDARPDSIAVQALGFYPDPETIHADHAPWRERPVRWIDAGSHRRTYALPNMADMADRT